ncbi:MAG: nucleotidyl transferase AbiEii/AbiGii toxin family protein [Cyclobacteriaceae bacterium]
MLSEDSSPETYGRSTAMFDHCYNEQLYPLQDSVLSLVGSLPTPFYLTGGTALSRFLLHHRFSDDLDFFVTGQPDFIKRSTWSMMSCARLFLTPV